MKNRFLSFSQFINENTPVKTASTMKADGQVLPMPANPKETTRVAELWNSLKSTYKQYNPNDKSTPEAFTSIKAVNNLVIGTANYPGTFAFWNGTNGRFVCLTLNSEDPEGKKVFFQVEIGKLNAKNLEPTKYFSLGNDAQWNEAIKLIKEVQLY